MPSPTRTITPSESPAQPKRKLETTVSTENATGGAKKKEKAVLDPKQDPSKKSIPEAMEIDIDSTPSPPEEQKKLADDKDMDTMASLKKIEEICDDLMEKSKEPEKVPTPVQTPAPTPVPEKVVETPAPAKKPVVKKSVTSSPAKKETPKNKTADLSGVIETVAKDKEVTEPKQEKVERKNSLPDDNLGKPTEKRKSRIMETAEKFQNLNNQNNEKYRKFTIPGVSVGNFKKEFERKASLTSLDKKPFGDKPPSSSAGSRKNSGSVEPEPFTEKQDTNTASASNTSSASKIYDEINQSDSKGSVSSFSLEEARRSMENSIALLNKAKNESAKEVEQLCAKTESVAVSDETERERKLRAAREIIGNAIPPSRLIGVRKPPVPFGINGRSISGSVVQPNVKPLAQLKSQFSADSIESRPAGRLSVASADRMNRDTVVPEKGKFEHFPFFLLFNCRAVVFNFVCCL